MLLMVYFVIRLIGMSLLLRLMFKFFLNFKGKMILVMKQDIFNVYIYRMINRYFYKVVVFD